MTTEDKHDKHLHNPLHDHELEQKEVHEVVVFLRENGLSLAIAIAIGVVASLGIIVYRHSHSQKKMYGSQALKNAQSVEALNAVARDFEGTPAALLAELELAATHFQKREYKEALTGYQSFVDENPKHEMAPAASVCIALCQESLGDTDQALSIAQKFIAEHPDNFMTPMAVFLKARILAKTESLDDARTTYEDFIAGNPDSLWISQAKSALMEVNRRIRASKKS